MLREDPNTRKSNKLDDRSHATAAASLPTGIDQPWEMHKIFKKTAFFSSVLVIAASLRCSGPRRSAAHDSHSV